MKTSEIKELTVAEIVEKINVDKEKLVRMRLSHAVSPLDNPQEIKDVRRNIARLSTVLCQRQINQSN